MRASVLAPVALALGVASAPAHAADDPVGAVKGAVGNVAPAPAADLLDPVTSELSAVKVEGVLATAKGTAGVKRAKDGSRSAVARLGKGVLKTADGDMAFAGVVAQCTAAADGTVRGVTRILGTGTAGAALPAGIPAAPPAGFRVPTADPGVVVMLNKQVRDPMGGMTVSAMTIDGAPGTGGVTRELGVTRCVPLERLSGQAAGTTAAASGARTPRPIDVPPPAPLGGLTDGLPLNGVTEGLPINGMAAGLPVGQIGRLTEVTQVTKSTQVTKGLTGSQRRQSRDAVTDTVGGLLGTAAAHGAALPQVGGLTNPQGLTGAVPAVPGIGKRARQAPVPATDALDGVTVAGHQVTAPVRTAADAAMTGATAGLPASQAGLSGIFGGLPGLNGVMPATALPALPALPAVPATPQLPVVPLGH
ncbi:hypothetical protein [Spirillospora sp. NPDC047279]|uniref:hypothetical protein n=1 Tax=Spirillospora sp. NPDC047279 TaxID=3155478 RepID=UPI0033FCA6CD